MECLQGSFLMNVDECSHIEWFMSAGLIAENDARGIGEGIQIARNTWHGVLTPLAPPGLFAVIDRIGEGPNLQEHWFDTPYTVTAE